MRFNKALHLCSLFLLALCFSSLLSACGQKGPLILPPAPTMDTANPLKKTETKTRADKPA